MNAIEATVARFKELDKEFKNVSEENNWTSHFKRYTIAYNTEVAFTFYILIHSGVIYIKPSQE